MGFCIILTDTFNTFHTFTLVSGWRQSILQYRFDGNTCCWEAVVAQLKSLWWGTWRRFRQWYHLCLSPRCSIRSIWGSCKTFLIIAYLITVLRIVSVWFSSLFCVPFLTLGFYVIVLKVMREISTLKQIDGPDPNFKDTCFHVAARYYILQTLWSIS